MMDIETRHKLLRILINFWAFGTPSQSMAAAAGVVPDQSTHGLALSMQQATARTVRRKLSHPVSLMEYLACRTMKTAHS
eukprot:COSAG02_NODE_43582_length_373_cov_1.025547_1_plen_79_part_00